MIINNVSRKFYTQHKKNRWGIYQEHIKLGSFVSSRQVKHTLCLTITWTAWWFSHCHKPSDRKSHLGLTEKESSWVAAGLLLCILASPSEFPYTKHPSMWRCCLCRWGWPPRKTAKCSGGESLGHRAEQRLGYASALLHFVCIWTCCRWLSK